MGSVEVVPISLPRETERFVRTWFTIYEHDPHWVPPLYSERKQFFDPAKNPYFNHARVAYFLACKDGRDVGTIAACIDTVYQKKSPVRPSLASLNLLMMWRLRRHSLVLRVNGLPHKE